MHLPNWYFYLRISPLSGRAICVVQNSQCLRFGDSHSSEKFTVMPKIVSHPTSSQEFLEQNFNVYIYIVHHLRGQWHSPISPKTEKIPFFDSYSLPVIFMTHISPSFLMNDRTPNTLQWHLSTVLIQDVVQLINIGRIYTLFDHAVFNTYLFLRYKETMGNFCRTSVNPLSEFLKAVMSEFSIQVTNLHSDINGHQNTSMAFLYSDFRQIYDNVTTILRITTQS